MSNLGVALKQARERRNMTLRQVESEINIRMQYIGALEDGRYDQLPGKVYGLGFLRSYAKFLEVDDHELVEELKQYWHDEGKNAKEGKPIVRQAVSEERVSSRNLSHMAGYALAAVACIGLIYFASTQPKESGRGTEKVVTQSGVTKNLPADAAKKPVTGGESLAGTTLPAPQSSALSSPTSPGALAPSLPTPSVGSSTTDAFTTSPSVPYGSTPVLPALPTPSNVVAVTLTVSQDQSWMSISEDGVPRFEGILMAGQQMSFLAKEKVFVHVGNAGVVDVMYNGINIGPMGGLKEVKRKEFLRS